METLLPQWTTDKDLEDLCAQFGKVKQVKFFENKQNGRSKGYALVEFYDTENARQAIEGLKGWYVPHREFDRESTHPLLVNVVLFMKSSAW